MYCCFQTKTRQLHKKTEKKNVAAKVMTTFLALILTLNNFILTQIFTFKSKAVLWEQNASLHTQIHSCPSLKRDASILSLKTNPAAVYALSTISLWYGPNQSTNLNSSQMK